LGDDIAARVDELTVITPEVLDNFELALRDIYHGRTFHADIDVVKVATEKTFTDKSLTRRLFRFRVSGIALTPRIGIQSSRQSN
jgi:hypothetical protein